MSSASASSSSFHPTTRSRTGLFLSYRESSLRPTRFTRSRSSRYDDPDPTVDENEGLIQSHVALDINLPPKWVDLSDQVDEILADTHAKITSLDKLHAKHVLPGFSDRSQEEREIEAFTTDITRDFRRCQLLIQKIGTDSHAFPPSQSNGTPAGHDSLTAKNVQRALAAKVQQLSAAFRKKQRVYMEKLQGHAIKNQDLLIASGTVSLKGTEGLNAVDDDVAAATHTRSQSQSLTQAEPSLDIRMRNRELTEIANSIASLAELFKDLSVLVIDQGTLLDSIEYNIEQTAAHVGEAVKELDIATRYQKNTARRKCILLLILIIFGLVVVLIFKPKRHTQTMYVLSPPPPSSTALPMSILSPLVFR
ncbi:t-SNARE [Pluteus cervinus]|uniref:t-SNARE n=1 Tax=Pluteus cervinus TaxID=181527 RepID=A0ACD3BCI4_9AGAR|nr:t-SNARE [Pluteus cervinus]